MRFATALQEANDHPTALTAEAKEASDRLKKAQAELDSDQGQIDHLKKALAGAKESAKDALQQQLQLLQAQADLDQDEVDDAHQDLIRAGGDPQGIIQRMKTRYEAREQASGGIQNLVPSGRAELGGRNTGEQHCRAGPGLVFAAWEISAVAGGRSGRTGAKFRAESESRQIGSGSRQTENAGIRGGCQCRKRSRKQAALPAASNVGAAKISKLKKRAATRRNLEVFDKRIEDEQQLAETYKRWSTLVRERERQCMHRILYCLLWILIIALLAIAMADVWISHSFANLAADRKQADTLHSVTGYAIKGARVVDNSSGDFRAAHTICRGAGAGWSGAHGCAEGFYRGLYRMVRADGPQRNPTGRLGGDQRNFRRSAGDRPAAHHFAGNRATGPMQDIPRDAKLRS